MTYALRFLPQVEMDVPVEDAPLKSDGRSLLLMAGQWDGVRRSLSFRAGSGGPGEGGTKREATRDR